MPNESFKEKIRDKYVNAKIRVVYYCKLGTQKVMATVRWIKENPQQAAVIASAAAGVSSVMKRGLRYAQRRRETFNKERFIYDRSTNTYCKTTRKLKGTDVMKINDLKRNQGLKTSEALERLGLLK